MLLKAALKGVKPTTGQRLFHTSNRYLQKQPFSESALNGNNSLYLEQMYESWQRDQSSVHPSWNAYFSTLDHEAGTQQVDSGAKTDRTSADAVTAARNALRVRELVQSYQKRGHEKTDVDPLRKFRHISSNPDCILPFFRLEQGRGTNRSQGVESDPQGV